MLVSTGGGGYLLASDMLQPERHPSERCAQDMTAMLRRLVQIQPRLWNQRIIPAAMQKHRNQNRG